LNSTDGLDCEESNGTIGASAERGGEPLTTGAGDDGVETVAVEAACGVVDVVLTFVAVECSDLSRLAAAVDDDDAANDDGICGESEPVLIDLRTANSLAFNCVKHGLREINWW
jgi:hypothetical protein